MPTLEEQLCEISGNLLTNAQTLGEQLAPRIADNEGQTLRCALTMTLEGNRVLRVAENHYPTPPRFLPTAAASRSAGANHVGVDLAFEHFRFCKLILGSSARTCLAENEGFLSLLAFMNSLR